MPEVRMPEVRISAEEVCACIGMPYEVIGTLSRTIYKPSPIEQADADSLAFCSAKVDISRELISKCNAAVVLCSSELKPHLQGGFSEKTIILVPNPRLAFIRVLSKYFQHREPCAIAPSAQIESTAMIGRGVSIGPHSYIGERTVIDENTVIHGHVFVYGNVSIGRNVTIHAGVVIGADGFSYERNEEDEFEKFPHLGGVVIGDDVEIGANTCIDRGTMGNTVIGEGTKIDNLCHVAHNVVIGKHCLIIAQSMIGGSTRIGDYSWVAPCACIRDRTVIGKKVTVGMGSVVVKNVGDGQVVLGVPARARNRTD